MSVKRLVANALLLDVSMNSHLWALQVELMVLPVLLALYFAERRWGELVSPIIALGTTALAFTTYWAGSRAMSIHMFAFPLGMAVPTLGRRFAEALPPKTASRWIVLSVGILLAAGPCLGVYSIFSTIIEAYVFAGLISLVAYRTDLSLLRCLDAGWCRQLGAASGSYYVLHMATVPAVLAIANCWIPPGWSAAVPGVVGLAAVAVWLAAIAPIMTLTYWLVERPGIEAGRRLTRYLGFDPAAESSTQGIAQTRRMAA